MADVGLSTDGARSGDTNGLLRDVIGKWYVWAIAAGCALMVWYTTRNPAITPNGYKLWFSVAAVVTLLYGVQSLDRVRDVI